MHIKSFAKCFIPSHAEIRVQRQNIVICINIYINIYICMYVCMCVCVCLCVCVPLSPYRIHMYVGMCITACLSCCLNFSYVNWMPISPCCPVNEAINIHPKHLDFVSHSQPYLMHRRIFSNKQQAIRSFYPLCYGLLLLVRWLCVAKQEFMDTCLSTITLCRIQCLLVMIIQRIWWWNCLV